jgi:CBS domain-containing protein
MNRVDIALNARDVMPAAPPCVPAWTTMSQLMRLFRQHRAPHAAVAGRTGAFLGMVSARDVMSVFSPTSEEWLIEQSGPHRAPSSPIVAEALFCALDFVTRDVITVPPDMPVSQVADLRISGGGSPVVVVDPGRVPVDIIGTDRAALSTRRGPRSAPLELFEHTHHAQGAQP